MVGPESLLERLSQRGVRFVLVGGYAAVAHGASVVTQDVDICCDFTVANLLRLADALADLHPAHRMTPQKLPLLLTRENAGAFKNLYLQTDRGQLDCLSEVAGLGAYADVRKRSVWLSTPWGKWRVLSLDALIEAKRAMGRPRDLAAVRELTAIRERKERGSE